MGATYSKSLLLITAWIFMACPLQAQPHYDSWFRITGDLSLSNKIRIDAELQHRRQNGFESYNPFDKPLMLAFRGWIHYQRSENFRYSFSPFAWFANYRIVRQPADETTKPGNEMRVSAAADGQHKIPGKWSMLGRSAIEYRIFENNQPDIIRVRNRLGIRYDFSAQVRLSVYDELLFNIAGTSTNHFFDHNRIGVMMEQKISRGLKLEAGYIYVNRLPVTNDMELTEHNFILNIIFQFKKQTSQPGQVL